jgi:hypothetical protein
MGAVRPTALLGGFHWRVVTPRGGALHVWRPRPGPGRGVVLYVHGHRVDADEAWTTQHLPEQFAASGKDALFVVPEAPKVRGQALSWPNLDELLRAVASATGFTLNGPVVAMGHSAAYRTIHGWLDDPRLVHVTLLDALYGGVDKYRAWARQPGHKLDLIGYSGEPLRNSLQLADELNAVRLSQLPASSRELDQAARTAKTLFIRSQWDHFALVNRARPAQVLLARTGVADVEKAPTQPQQERRPSRALAFLGGLLVSGVVLAGGALAVRWVHRRRPSTGVFGSLMGYYQIDPTHLPPLVDVAKRWAKHGDKAYDPEGEPWVFWYPIEEVLPYREYIWTRERARHSPEEWDVIKNSMVEHGWTTSAEYRVKSPKSIDPAHVIFGRNGYVKVGEGNHRLAIAKELGIKQVPVRFHFYERVEPFSQSPDARAVKIPLDGLATRPTLRGASRT